MAETQSMYGVERSVVALTKEVGIVEGKAILEVSGSEGVGMVELRSGLVAFGRSHAVYFSSVFSSSTTNGGGTDLVRVDLELDLQHRVRDVVEQVCSAHPTLVANVKAPASIGVVRLSDRFRCCINNRPQVGIILDCGCGEGQRRKDDAREEHGG